MGVWQAVSVVALMLVGAGCRAAGPLPEEGLLFAYITGRSTAWWQSGSTSLTLVRGDKQVGVWTKEVGASRFGSLGAPAFTEDGRFVFARYGDEQAGRYPYDGGDIHTSVVSIEVAGGRARETAIESRSRSQHQGPSRAGSPYALTGSTVVWQAPAAPQARDGEVKLMQLDLGASTLEPSVLRTVQLPQRTAEQRALPDRDYDFVGNVVGAGHGRVAIAKRYAADDRIQADRLFLVEPDGAVRELSRTPTKYWVKAAFSPDGSRLAYETGTQSEAGFCNRHQVTVFDTATGQQASDFPAGPFDATSRPYFYSSDELGAIWWTPDGKLRATGSAETCPARSSGTTTPEVRVWELRGKGWVQIAPPGTYRDYPLPNGESAVIKKRERLSGERQPGQPETVTSLFIRTADRMDPVMDVDVSGVAIGAG